MNVRLRLVVVLAAAILVLGVSPGFGQATPTTPVNPLAAQRKAVADAQAKVNSLHGQIAQIHAKIEATFEARPDWVAAKKTLADAQGKYDAALKPVMAALLTNADYQQLVTNRKAAQDKLDELKSAPSATDSSGQQQQDDAMSAAAGDVLTDGFAMNKMEREALANDPALSAAKAELSDAKQGMDTLEQQVTTAMQADPEYQTTQTELTTAEQQLATARTALLAAEKASQRTVTPAPAPAPTGGGGYRKPKAGD